MTTDHLELARQQWNEASDWEPTANGRTANVLLALGNVIQYLEEGFEPTQMRILTLEEQMKAVMQAQRDTADFLEARAPASSTPLEPCSHPAEALLISSVDLDGATLLCPCGAIVPISWLEA